MASTYSTSLKLTLIGDGDQTGTWGQTTNLNLGDLLDQAVAGQTTIIMANADYTLTSLNGALDEARNAVIIVTGNQNATYSVIVPQVKKLYMVYNNLSASATAYIKMSGGTTTQVPNGQTMYLYCTGVIGASWGVLNYVQNAQNLVTGGTITTGAINCTSLTSSGAVSGTTITASTQFSGPGTGITGLPLTTGVTGTLPVVNGGTGVVTSTGSGNNVLSTSPTLVTPLLGIPTSGVMTNVTGLPLTTGVTGTLPVGNGGTGATTLTSNGVVYGNGTSAAGITAAGTTGQVLIATTSGAPSWGSVPSTAAVTSITFGSTGLTPSTATTGVVTVAGTLAVANGGTGVTTSTGSTNVVLSTSPTLVTPILGTPQSVTLTNATGLPLTTGVTGTLPVTNGGTGVVTSTGSGSVVLSTSPTLVTPLLGTPTSGNLTNCTFPTLNQNTTGNAATATLATNAAGLTGTPNISVDTIASGLQTITTPTTSNTLTMLGYGLSVTGTLSSTPYTSVHSPLGIRNTYGAYAIYVDYPTATKSFLFRQDGNFEALALTSSVSTGTAPFTVASTTPVTNLSIGGNAATATNATTAATVSTTIASGAVGTTQTAGDNSTKIATTAFVAAAMAVLYPIGSIYTSTVSTNPNTLFGFGTWVAFADARVMIGAGVSYPAGSTGGSADAVVVAHNHPATSTVTDPGHNHLLNATNDGVVGGSNNLGPGSGSNSITTSATDTVTTSISVATSTSNTGVSPTNANMQPFISVYMWNRTA